MYKENLPENCPPIEADGQEIFLYRAFAGDSLVDTEFIPYVYINDNFKETCRAYGLSFFLERDKLLKRMRKLIESGIYNYIAKILIKPEFGKLLLTGTKTGHYTLWLYDTFDISLISEIEIYKI